MEAVEVVFGLLEGAVEVSATGFVLDEEFAFPEEIDEAAVAVGFGDGGLKGGDAAAGDAEDVEEGVPEGLGFGVLGGVVFPLAGEGGGVGADFVPGERHSVVVDEWSGDVQVVGLSARGFGGGWRMSERQRWGAKVDSSCASYNEQGRWCG